MDLSVAFLGTGGAVPSARRSTASLLVSRGGERLMFDCGEGTQRQLQKSLGLVQVDEVYLTHFHADHFLGLPGMLKTYDLTDRETPLTVYGPRGLRDLFKTLGRLIGRIGFRLDLVEVEPGDVMELEGGEIRAFEVRHSVRACGYALVEVERPGRFDLEAAKRLGVPEGPAFAALQRGEAVSGSGGPVSPEQVVGDPRPGRTVVITGDTGPCEATVEAARGAELLVHDASFAEEERQRALDTGHSTIGQAAAIAREAEVKMLAAVHISSRYHVGAVLEEARAVFEPTVAPRDFDLVEIPFPERGDPELIPKGARERGGEGETDTSGEAAAAAESEQT
jgi:ribonuclease Z